MLNNISRYITARYLSRMNAKHVSQYPQLVGYFFDTITSAIHIDGRFERDELSLLSTNVFPKLNNEGDCLDIGANIGNHSLAFSPFFKNAKVPIMVPSRDIIKILPPFSIICFEGLLSTK